MRAVVLALACIVLVFPASAAAGDGTWSLRGTLLGGQCDDYLVESETWTAKVTTCAVFILGSIENGTGPTRATCREDRCITGRCPERVVLHSNRRRGPIDACFAAINQSPRTVRVSGWLAGGELMVLKLHSFSANS